MAPQESLSFDTAPQTLVPKKQEENSVVSKTPETNPRLDAFTRCSRVFQNDTGNPIQDREEFFDFLKKQSNSEECYKILTTCSEDVLKKTFDADELGFKGMCSLDWVKMILKQSKETSVQNLSETQSQRLTELQSKLAKHPELNQKNVEIISSKDADPQSPEFQKAAKSILAELKAQAEKSWDFKEYASFIQDFHAIGAVSNAEYAVFQRELSELSEKARKDKSDKKSDEFKLPEGFRANKDSDGVYTKYSSTLWEDRFDEVVTLNKEGKGSKDIISARSGYKRHLDNVINSEEQKLVTREAQIHSIIDNSKTAYENIKNQKITPFLLSQQKFIEDNQSNSDTETQKKVTEAKKQVKETEEYMQKETEKIAEKQTELLRVQEILRNIPKTPDSAQKEASAREVIDLVDNMGLYTLGVDNVDVFFDIIGEKSATGKIDLSDKVNFTSKKPEIKKAFLGLLGEGGKELFDESGTFRLKEGKTSKDVQDLLKTKPFYHIGEVPPVKAAELRMAMNGETAQTI